MLQGLFTQKGASHMGFWDAFKAPPPPKCECGTEMISRGEVAGAYGLEMINFMNTLWQCPKCKNIQVGKE